MFAVLFLSVPIKVVCDDAPVQVRPSIVVAITADGQAARCFTSWKDMFAESNILPPFCGIRHLHLSLCPSMSELSQPICLLDKTAHFHRLSAPFSALSRPKLHGGDTGFQTRVRWVCLKSALRHRELSILEQAVSAAENANSVRTCGGRTRKHGSVCRSGTKRKQRKLACELSYIPPTIDACITCLLLTCMQMFGNEPGLHVTLTTCIVIVILILCSKYTMSLATCVASQSRCGHRCHESR